MAKVIVVGSINMDIVARTQQLPRPGETVIGSELSYSPGGKGSNQAIAAAKTGVKTLLIGSVGNDSFADPLINFLKTQGVDTKLVKRSAEQPSGTALITVSNDS